MNLSEDLGIITKIYRGYSGDLRIVSEMIFHTEMDLR